MDSHDLTPQQATIIRDRLGAPSTLGDKKRSLMG
jgi:hypothetical protein